MIELIIGFAIGTIAVVVDRMWRRSRLRGMRRHPTPTFVFADLAGYTALTEEFGDEAAAAVARRFRREMQSLSRTHGALQVKSMGDGVMILGVRRGEGNRARRRRGRGGGGPFGPAAGPHRRTHGVRGYARA
jgi:hypothetical protein